MMCAGSESVLCTSAAGCGRRRRVVLRYYDITHAGGPRGLLLQQRAAAVSSFSSNNNVLPLRGCPRAAVAKISSAQCDPLREVYYERGQLLVLLLLPARRAATTPKRLCGRCERPLLSCRCCAVPDRTS